MSETPLCLQIHPDDNVAIVVSADGLAAGTVLGCGVTLRDRVPQGHKVSLTDLDAGAPIRRYGEVIGVAARAIPQGSWITESVVRLLPPPPLDSLSVATRRMSAPEPLAGYTFEGYRNADGSVGTRNLLAISTSVQCVAGVMEHAVRRIRQDLLPRFPNVDGVVALTHTYGCGVAIDAPGAAIPIRTLRNLARNPNFGGAPLVVGLGCEKLRPEWLLPDGGKESGNKDPGSRDSGSKDSGSKNGRGADGGGIIQLQDQQNRGFGDMIAAIMTAAEQRLTQLNRRERVTCPAADLVVGMQCGGSDAFSGITANPAVGFATDLLVRAGATVMFSEVTEVRDAIHLLVPRAANEAVGRALIREMGWYDTYLQGGGADRSANTTPGNKRGGLSNIVEKALGSVVKSGSLPIAGVLAPGERVDTKGLIFAATPASDFICGTLQLASGMTLEVFTTGRGTPYSLAAAPVIKMSSRTALAEQWHDLIDIDAGRIATGQATIEDIGWELFRLILDVASGRKRTWAEHWDLHNDLVLFNPGPVT